MSSSATRTAQVSESWIPDFFKLEGYKGEYVVVHNIYAQAMAFLLNNLAWLKETGGAKTLLIKIPDAIVQISKRIGPSESIPGKLVNRIADVLAPLHALGSCAKTLLAFADVGSKFPKMFDAPKSVIDYVVKDKDGNFYKAQFPIHPWEQWANRALNVADWSLCFSECAGYIWKLRCAGSNEQFPLATFTTWTPRYMSIKSLYSEGQFLYKTLWVGQPTYNGFTIKKTVYDNTQKKHATVPAEKLTLATHEIIGSLLNISLAVACLSIDVFKTLASKENSPLWLSTALFCATLAPTFITPVVGRYWPAFVTTPRYKAASPAG